MKSSVRSQTKLIFEILTRGSPPGRKWRTFTRPETRFIALRDLVTYYPKYNTHKRRRSRHIKNKSDDFEDCIVFRIVYISNLKWKNCDFLFKKWAQIFFVHFPYQFLITLIIYISQVSKYVDKVTIFELHNEKKIFKKLSKREDMISFLKKVKGPKKIWF